MANNQKSYIRTEQLSKADLRTMLAEALQNSDHVETVHVPLKKRALPTRQKPVASETDELTAEKPANEPTKGQKKRS